MQFFPIVNKARRPKFDVHIKISDLNNVPLVSGVSMVKWHLPHSIHGEHRGRTQKCPILNHRVEYNYSKVVPVRIGIDRNDSLNECPIEFEVLQEFSAGGISGAAGRDEKITLGTIRLNLSEYVEESEAVLRDGNTANAIKEALLMSPIQKSSHRRKRSSLSNTVPAETEPSPRSSRDEERPATEVQDGVVRRYLMQDSKINSTLKISILMVQVDGERNYVAPPPKSAPVFGGIAGFVAGDAFEPVDVGVATAPGHAPSSFSGKSRDVFEVQDMYRRALAASWASQPGELPADQCIENIFSGGEGFEQPLPLNSTASHAQGHSRHHTAVTPTVGTDDDTSPNPEGEGKGRRTTGRGNFAAPQDDSGSLSDDEAEESGDMMGTLRPRDVARLQQLQQQRHLRDQSVASDRSVATVLPGWWASGSESRDFDRESSRGIGLNNITANGTALREPFPSFHHHHHHQHHPYHRREESKITHAGLGLRSRSSSLVSLATATTLGSERDRGREGFKRAREVDEFEVREDLVAWTVPGALL
ncbi:N-terminal C2 in EEIG1 and EHBP1 proteins-domain-containing protein [Corynascus novoguineensis]|uniref:N-terminal C2 in EEIG1 and EHBP1 proteins-domain-containing protein n=1 Tax=Corynascus novoguineensis TaxID=1126955 RepID=A0AAN7D1J6_9PEZI|nr:N-terminal C2 in EEIG1 and EHBP1 proteins-domain-containing protein [Corynascus novoguineensis]